MAFVDVAIAIGFAEGTAATIAGGAMLGGTMTIGANLITGNDPFANIGQGILMGGLTAGLTPGVAAELGVSKAVAAGITAGGLNALATGDLSKGLVAGLGAYGMANLTAGAPVNPNGVDPSAAANAMNPAPTMSSNNGYDPGSSNVITPAASGGDYGGYGTNSLSTSGDYMASPKLPGYGDLSLSNAQDYIEPSSEIARSFGPGEYMENASNAPTPKSSLGDKLSAKYDAIAKDPKAFLKANASNLMYAAAPLLAGASTPKLDMPQTTTQPGMIRPYSFDPYSGQYTAQRPYLAAEGGLMGMNDGGYSPGQLNFAQRSEPVVRMASGGIASFAVGGGVSNEDIQAYMNANQGANDATIAAKMQETGVTPQQLASAMGYDPQVIAQKYAAAVGAPTFAPGNPNSPDYKGSLPPAATTTPAYTNYSTQDITNYLQNNPNANITDAIRQNNADPAAVNKAIAGLAINKIGADFSDPTQTGRGTGTSQYTDIFNKYGIDAKELFAAEKALNPNYTFAGVGDSTGMERAFKTAKDFQNFTPQGTSEALKDVEWVRKMDATGSNAVDIARLTGVSIGEVQAREAAARALLARGMGVGDLKTVDIVPGMGGGVSGAGVTTVNPNGTVTTTPDIPGRPAGGFTGVSQVKDAYTKGGGSLGYTPYVPKTIEEFDNKYTSRLTGGSKQAYDYLTGKTPYNPKPYTATGELQRPYSEAAIGLPADLSTKQYLFDAKTRTYKVNPDYAIPVRDSKGVVSRSLTNKDVTEYIATKPSEEELIKWATTNNLSDAQIAAATGMPITQVYKLLKREKPAATTATAAETKAAEDEAAIRGVSIGANGGLMSLARGGSAHSPFFSRSTGKFSFAGPKVYADGGATEQYDLGGYSDGGRLLRGPGDGVSDSIPATIGNKRPARLADGEFVVPARIVSELGNGSTEAGARKLYAMMERVQAARKGSIGKGKVAKNSRADKYFPA